MLSCSFLRTARTIVWERHDETLKICVPSVIYMLQNNLYYLAMSNLEPTTYCVRGVERVLLKSALSIVCFC